MRRPARAAASSGTMPIMTRTFALLSLLGFGHELIRDLLGREFEQGVQIENLSLGLRQEPAQV